MGSFFDMIAVLTRFVMFMMRFLRDKSFLNCPYCRDLQDATMRHFHSFMKTFVAILATVAFSGGHLNETAPNPELTGKLFETIGHLLKYVMILFNASGGLTDEWNPSIELAASTCHKIRTS
jgi:hypothetical protein